MRDMKSQKGNAAVELGLFIPIVIALLVLAVEGGFVLNAYSVLHESSREGARIVLRDSDVSQIPVMLQTLAPKLDLSKLRAKVTMDQGTKEAAVELTYDYPTWFGKYQGGTAGNWDPKNMTVGGLISGTVLGTWQQTVIEVDNDTRQFVYVFVAAGSGNSSHVNGVAEKNANSLGFGFDSLVLKARTVMPLS